VDQAHEQIANLCAMQGAIEQGIFSSMEIFPYSKLCSVPDYGYKRGEELHEPMDWQEFRAGYKVWPLSIRKCSAVDALSVHWRTKCLFLLIVPALDQVF
jgi:hypothetical protein